MTWWNFLKCFKITHFRLILRFRIILVLISDHTLLNDAVSTQFYLYQSSIFEIEQNFGSGPGKIMWCENLKIGIQNGKEKCTIMTGPLIDYPFTEGTLACVLVYVWENTLRYGRTTCESYRFEPLWWLQRSKCFSF